MKIKNLNEQCLMNAKIRRVSKDSRMKLYKTIRFSYIERAKLDKLNEADDTRVPREYIIEGLSAQNSDDPKANNIILEPRSWLLDRVLAKEKKKVEKSGGFFSGMFDTGMKVVDKIVGDPLKALKRAGSPGKEGGSEEESDSDWEDGRNYR